MLITHTCTCMHAHTHNILHFMDEETGLSCYTELLKWLQNSNSQPSIPASVILHRFENMNSFCQPTVLGYLATACPGEKVLGGSHRESVLQSSRDLVHLHPEPTSTPKARGYGQSHSHSPLCLLGKEEMNTVSDR